jgi:hypothetical protein
MTFETATFNPKEFELRNFTNPYVTPEQSTDIALTEDRVNSQLDFLAQMLGWNGPNYWGNLPTTPDQKRQLLGGTFGVYNSFFIPRVYECRNWNNTIVVDRLPFLQPGRQVYVEAVVVGNEIYKILSLSVEGDTYVVELEGIDDAFYQQISNNVPIEVVIQSLRPAPFTRTEVGVSGDASFSVAARGTELLLYPSYDTDLKFRYLSLSFFGDSVYTFNQPVYIKYDLANTVPDIYPTYDQTNLVWTLRIPSNIVSTAAPITSYLCWDYSDSATLTTVSTPVLIQQWVNPSDWNKLSTLRNFTGAWGNKGGSLPFNLAFDSLSIHGVSETNAIVFSGIERSVSYNELMTEVYSQLSYSDITAPGNPNPGDFWWNPLTGALSVWYAPENQSCAVWVEIWYREQPEAPIVPNRVYPDVTSFNAAAPTIPQGEIVQIIDANGLTTADGIIGLTGTISSNPSVILFQNVGAVYWTVHQFTFANVADFAADAEILPFKVETVIAEANGLAPVSSTYNVSNLGFQIEEPIPAVISKMYTNETWVIYPDSILRYISQSDLFGFELQGEMWWDYANPVEETRAASIYIQNAWVSVNYHSLSGEPEYYFSQNALRFYSNGALLTSGVEYNTEDYIIKYVFNDSTQEYDFTYTPLSLIGKTQLPVIEVSDSLESTYRKDISFLVFSGITYTLTPNVADSETLLRLWKTQDLQDAETVAHVQEDNYINPLIADQNNGPGLENWERYFVRLPLDYGRDEEQWQKTALICQDFGYWGSSIEPEFMRCPPEDDTPAIYEELFLYNNPIQDYTYVYCEPYLYSNIAFFSNSGVSDYANAGVFPGNEIPFDGYTEGELVTYDPLHNRLANTSAPVGNGYGDWEGVYTNISPCLPLTGFFVNDLADGSLTYVDAPLWDASIYKAPPTCENEPGSYSVDANHYKIGYAYFVADASAAEDGFFDVQQQSAWRFPTDVNQSLYLLPRAG